MDDKLLKAFFASGFLYREMVEAELKKEIAAGKRAIVVEHEIVERGFRELLTDVEELKKHL